MHTLVGLAIGLAAPVTILIVGAIYTLWLDPKPQARRNQR